VTHASGYVSVVKEVGIAAKSKIDKIFEVQLPENDFSNFDSSTPYIERAGASFSGKFFYVEY